jgi:DNA polymerase/3'-5' exonuclease PolX
MMEYSKALEAAKQVRKALLPACEKIVIAGSLRRQKADVRDIELVAQIKTGGLFDDAPDTAAFEVAISSAVNKGVIAWDTQHRANGEKYKRFTVPELDIAVDLFIATPANFGNILVIRTGNSDFSEKLVTKFAFGGLMPDDLRQGDGYLFRDGVRLECPTELAFFTALGLPVLDPAERNLHGVAKLRAHIETVGRING